MVRSALFVGVVVMIGGMVTGCDSRPTGDAIPATGMVLVDGEPAEGVMVTFVPEDTTPGNGGSGLSDSSGRFELSSGLEGVPPGKYRVLFEKLVMPDGSPVPPDTSPTDAGAVNGLPEWYSRPEQTNLRATVPSESESEMTFNLSSTTRR